MEDNLDTIPEPIIGVIAVTLSDAQLGFVPDTNDNSEED